MSALSKLKAEAAECQACDLWKIGTQTVFGEGKATSTVMFVGEQPGDLGATAAQALIGPKFRVSVQRAEFVKSPLAPLVTARLDRADLRVEPGAAGVDLHRVRLLVDAPLAARLPTEMLHHVRHVDREDLQGRPFVGPAGALLDKALEEAGIDRAPSSILRAPSDEARRSEMKRFIEDLKKIRKAIDRSTASAPRP